MKKEYSESVFFDFTPDLWDTAFRTLYVDESFERTEAWRLKGAKYLNITQIEQTFHRKVFKKIPETKSILKRAYFELSQRGAKSDSKVNQNGQKRKTKSEAHWIGKKWQSWFRTVSRKYSTEDFSNSTKWRNDFKFIIFLDFKSGPSSLIGRDGTPKNF